MNRNIQHHCASAREYGQNCNQKLKYVRAFHERATTTRLRGPNAPKAVDQDLKLKNGTIQVPTIYFAVSRRHCPCQ